MLNTPREVPTIQSLIKPLSGLEEALRWLAANEYSNGSYGNSELLTAAAAYALWLNDTNSAKAASSYFYLASQLDRGCPEFWFWKNETGYCPGEADVPGLVLYSIASTPYIDRINQTYVSEQLLQLQSPTGGFQGYCSYNQTSGACPIVTSAVDTAMAILGLDRHAGNLIPLKSQTMAVHYLLSLQNLDGGFNLTGAKSYDPLYSLGPDPVSITALTLLALNSAGQTITDSPIAKGLKFLSREIQSNLCANGHVYSAALSTLAFRAFNQSYDAVTNMLYILSQQNSDGGFRDISRLSPGSNALDTGWAAYALEPAFSIRGVNLHPTDCPPVATFTMSSQTPTAGQTVQFDASISRDTDQDQLSYEWTFGDGSGAEGVSATHAYTQAGSFTVTLTVTDSGTDPGPLSDTTVQTIVVQQATIEKSSSLPLTGGEFLILAGAVGIIGVVALTGFGFYLGRRSARLAGTPRY